MSATNLIDAFTAATSGEPNTPENRAESDTISSSAASPTPDQGTFPLASPRRQPAAQATTEGKQRLELDLDDPHAGTSFGLVPLVKGEFRAKLSALHIWQHHPRRFSREHGDHGPALTLTAENPDAMPPIMVLPAVAGSYPIMDGRFVWAALKAVHAGNEDVEVRCVLFPGTEADAISAACDSALGRVDASEIERAQALLSLQRVAGISQTAIAARYPRLTVSKVSLMLKAARMAEAYPVLFDLLIEPDRAPISYGNTIFSAAKTLSGEEFEAVLDYAADLISVGSRFKPGEALEALDLFRGDDETPAREVRAKPIVPVMSEAIHGFDDQPVAAYERLADNIVRIRLPDTEAMTLEEREAAAEACIAQVRRHFGLDVQG